MPASLRASLTELLLPSVCPACDAPRAPGLRRLCPTCASGLRALHSLAGVFTAIAYEGTGMALVQRFKFDGRRDALAVLLPQLAERVRGLRLDGVVAVPRHPARVRALGSDPTWALARALARRLDVPLRDGVLRRTRPTPPQTALDVRARRRNVAGSFVARPGALQGLRVLLLDDVATTCATIDEAAAALRAARPRGIVPAALAGTPPPAL